jgi:hypothetical protein
LEPAGSSVLGGFSMLRSYLFGKLVYLIHYALVPQVLGIYKNLGHFKWQPVKDETIIALEQL